MPDLLSTPRLNAMRQRVLQSQEETQRQEFLSSFIREIVNQLSDATIKGIDSPITIENMDEVRAALRNELRGVIKGLKDLNLTAEEQSEIMRQAEERTEKALRDDFQPVIIKKPRDRVEVTNFKDVIFPDNLEINNLNDLEKYFENLANVVRDTFNIEIPAPQVTVQPTPVNIPKQDISIPPVNFKPVVDAIRQGMNKINTNSKSRPLAVRLSDGQDFIDTLEKLVQRQEVAFQGFSDHFRIRNATNQMINPATDESVAPPSSIGTGNKDVASAGTAVTLTSTATSCKEVIITGKSTNTGRIYYGGSGVDSSNGAYIYAGQTARIPINDVSKVYIDADTNSEGVQYTYVS